MNRISFYIESYGCQMNAYDAEVISSKLVEAGNNQVEEAGSADVVIVNTCSVREHAETRVIGRLHDLARHRNAVLVVCGCMARRLGGSMIDLVPAVAVVASPDSYDELPHAIDCVIERGGKILLLGTDDSVTYRLGAQRGGGSPSRFVSITRGCENFCSYCIVPYLRGAVRSKDPAVVVDEIGMLIEAGAKEITLLGQNVMAYRHGTMDFPALLRRVLSETAVGRLRFLTTHPKDLNSAVFAIMADHRELCPHIHLPLQSGADRILGLMGRGYDRRHYLDIVGKARSIVPDLAITTDIIVGFPTESEAEFVETLYLVERIRFDSAFTFMYSPREGTAAAALQDDVPAAVKKERLRRLNASVTAIRSEILEYRIGEHAEILLDAPVQKGEYQFMKGRTPHFRNVLVPGEGLRAGDVVDVRLSALRNYTYIGEELARR